MKEKWKDWNEREKNDNGKYKISMKLAYLTKLTR